MVVVVGVVAVVIRNELLGIEIISYIGDRRSIDTQNIVTISHTRVHPEILRIHISRIMKTNKDKWVRERVIQKIENSIYFMNDEVNFMVKVSWMEENGKKAEKTC